MNGVLLMAALLCSTDVAAEEGSPLPLVLLDVPFLAQTEALCGGAAAAMVMRYWGMETARPEAFADLVDPGRGGITTGALVDRLGALGLRAHPFRGEATLVREHLARGRPVIALIEAGTGQLHYVVLVAWREDRVLFHDPALGPFRVEDASALRRRWAASDHWALLVLPGDVRPTAPEPPGGTAPGTASAPDGCDRLVDEAVERARAGSLGDAEQRLGAAVALCPERGRPLREIAALRFRQERWHDAALLAERATRLSPGDDHAWRLLATSLFLDGEPEAALRAWNRVGEPVLWDVSIVGLTRTRHDVVLAWIGLPIGEPLTPARLTRARRQLAELPAAALDRLSYRPTGGGRARVEAAVVERPLLASPWRLLTRAALDALTERQTRLRLDSPVRRGGRLELGVRWWTRRPAVDLASSTPRGLGLPGLVGVEAGWEEQAYATGAGAQPLIETTRRGAVTHGDWLTASLHLQLELAGERWSGRDAVVWVGGRLEQRLLGDRVALVLDGGGAHPFSGEPGFAAGSASLAVRTSASVERVVARGRFGVHAASAHAPLGRWPGAGVGHARSLLLRAHPLLEDGVIAGPAFGRRLLHASAEVEVEVATLGPARLGAAGFLDWARVRERLPAFESGPALADLGAGLRLRLPGNLPALRVDAATGIVDGGFTLSAGWQLAWPR